MRLARPGSSQTAAGKVRLNAARRARPALGPDRRTSGLPSGRSLSTSSERSSEGGEPAAADLVRRVGGLADTARDLAYRLYSICERKKWAEEALGYNALVTAWPEITRLAASTPGDEAPQQTQLFS